jgi:tetraacyldisaccharide 4'-kinase
VSGEKPDLPSSKDHPVGVITAIGDVYSFDYIIKSAGFDICHKFQYRDHHDYTTADLEIVRDECRRLKIERLFTTEKDAAKLRKICFEKPKIYVIKVAFRLTDGVDFLKIYVIKVAFRLTDGVDFLKQKIGELTQDVKRS